MKSMILIPALLASLSGSSFAGISAPVMVSGRVQSFTQKWIELKQASGTVIRVPRASLRSENDLKPGKEITVKLSSAEFFAIEGKPDPASGKKR